MQQQASNVEWLMMLQGTNNAYEEVQEEMVRSEGYGGGLSNYTTTTQHGLFELMRDFNLHIPCSYPIGYSHNQTQDQCHLLLIPL
ncbi:hypothetical protein Pyn_23084 [Prunus yedoensis var. nudiflora]|uniref:Uncharacterized protein n=1 Tax=Prunus yedoensis var. nudiflora TaxID=2094558 RepID=A0A314Y884_PRUYE|nr:hypothetical protein Pyn_23084 [Prunus yedoensis var. nudiflora]